MINGNEKDPILLWTEIIRLRAELKGPDGFETWKDAAVHERQLRVELQQKLKVTDEMELRALNLYFDVRAGDRKIKMRDIIEAALNGDNNE